MPEMKVGKKASEPRVSGAGEDQADGKGPGDERDRAGRLEPSPTGPPHRGSRLRLLCDAAPPVEREQDRRLRDAGRLGNIVMVVTSEINRFSKFSQELLFNAAWRVSVGVGDSAPGEVHPRGISPGRAASGNSP